jgi:hypothetical protein|uniref:Uncharacterized protein n=1 Tax=viral metagenome TaxID=1070528 RepID=A0A6C0LG37_9ZZZZ
MTISQYLIFFILVIISVLALRGDLAYIFPELWNHVNNIEYYLGNVYSIFFGYKLPVNPNASNQSDIYNPTVNILMVSILFFILFLVYNMYSMI